ncbi:MAG TPA: alcohol dehydrogenase [Sulfurospirillum sp. UBA12182]|jgi:alcohol dehydrogenase class IV|nr:MAG TPA: alcohol dehydrogenase [Sulfurospirillum sp. UBA12182]
MSTCKVELALRKCVTPEFIFGTGARNLAGKYAKNLGAKRVLLVSDIGVQNAGWVDDVIASLNKASLSYTLFTDIVPNPRDFNVKQGVEIYKQYRCDGIVCIGGGSVIDCAKGIGIVVANGDDILTYEGIDKINSPLPPLICIPTTAGSSADVSQFAIINDTNRKVKIAIISKSIVPDVALIDPQTTLSMDYNLTIYTGLDALTHAIEAYVSNANSSITDMYALEAIKYLYTALPQVAQNLENLEARGAVMMGSLLAGLAFSNASLGAVHAMAHSLGGWLDLPHGLCNAILLDKVIQFNLPYANEKYKPIARIFETKSSQDLVKSINDFKTNLKLTQSLEKMGVTKSVIPHLSSMALKDACMITNPKFPNQQEVEEIFHNAL